MIFELNNDVNDNLRTDKIMKQKERITYCPLSTINELEELIHKIDRDMFDSDRISLDPCFNTKTARNRYVNWIQDEFSKKGTVLCSIDIDNKNAGFFLLKKINTRTYFQVMIGLFSSYKGFGYGKSVIEQPILWSKKMGICTLRTRVSSNNIISLKCHLSLGYTIDKGIYVLRRIPKQNS